MLTGLSIKNVAVIDKLTVDFHDGVTVLTGETGAGKSLVVDALSLLLGEKADKSLISYGEKTASVEAVFSSVSPLVKETLKELVGEEDDEHLETIEDETLLDEVFAEFCNQYEDSEDADEAAMLEPDEE